MLLRDLVQHAAAKFRAAGIDSAIVDAELIAAFALGISRGEVQAQMLSGAEVTQSQAENLTNLFARRNSREPLQHITGLAPFRNLELAVGLGVFIPRPETEFVAGLAIEALRASSQNNPIAVDLGTGSGAIALAMATEVPNAKVHAVEKSADAFAFTKQNFANYAPTAQLILGDLRDAFAELDGKVAVVASNPPYIPAEAIPRDIEVHKYDPALALYGGADGMDVIYLVSASAKRLLLPGGFLVIEHADNQGAQVSELLLADGWSQVTSRQDLTGRDRAVTAIK